MKLNLLEVKIDNLSKQEILQKISCFLQDNKMRHIVTTNPEIILQAQKDEMLKNTINNSDLSVADGIGVKFALWRFGKNLKCRFAGIDLMWEILRMANEKKLSVFLVANKKGLSGWQETAETIKKEYPKLRIRGVNIKKRVKDYQLQIANSDVLFCNFGAPWQEKFIANLKKRNVGVKLAVGVGGSFDFISGKIKRAPKWMRFLGLEWLWRLFQQPHRLKRIFKAVVIFPIRILVSTRPFAK